MTITVLAGSYQETNAFARQKGLGYGIRHIVNADTLRGARPSEVHVLPSYYTRRDVHAVNSVLKRIERKSRFKRIEYELTPAGVYVVASDRVDVVDPPVNPTRKPKAEKPSPQEQRVNAVQDTSANAVPGQTAIEEHLADVPEAPAAEQNFRSAPDDESLDFLDD